VKEACHRQRAGGVTTGFMTDTGLISDPTPLARRYQEELARLC
jgi:hypothetical protein